MLLEREIQDKQLIQLLKRLIPVQCKQINVMSQVHVGTWIRLFHISVKEFIEKKMMFSSFLFLSSLS